MVEERARTKTEGEEEVSKPVRTCDFCGKWVGKEGWADKSSGYCEDHVSKRPNFMKTKASRFIGKKEKPYLKGDVIHGEICSTPSHKKPIIDQFDWDGKL